MTRIQVAPRGHRHVLRSRSAAGNTLIDTGTALQIDHVVIEGKGLPFFVPLQHQLRQLFILLHDDRFVRLCQSGRIAGGGHHRFHAQFGKAQIQHSLDVLEKIGVGMGKRAAHIVVLPLTGRHQFLELGHDLLPASVAGIVHTVAVVYLLASIKAQHHITHLTVDEVDHIIVDQYAVCR